MPNWSMMRPSGQHPRPRPASVPGAVGAPLGAAR